MQAYVIKQSVHDTILNDLKTQAPGRLQAYTKGPTCNFLQNTDFEGVPTKKCPPNLKMKIDQGVRSKDDAANAELVWGFIGDLQRSWACDSRYWVTLTHRTFWDYTQWRWPAKSQNPDRLVDHIKSHWFVTGSPLERLRRNSIARLWWAAKLTRAPWARDQQLSMFRKTDDFHYTKILLSSQQVFQDVLERTFGSDSKLLICFLDAFEERMQGASDPRDKVVQAATKRLLLTLKVKHLSAMDASATRKSCLDILQSVKV